MTWEFLGKQALETSGRVFRGFDALLWRARVPGGWFVVLDRDGTATSFHYPDPDHVWDGQSLALSESDTLLRPSEEE